MAKLLIETLLSGMFSILFFRSNMTSHLRQILVAHFETLKNIFKLCSF